MLHAVLVRTLRPGVTYERLAGALRTRECPRLGEPPAVADLARVPRGRAPRSPLATRVLPRSSAIRNHPHDALASTSSCRPALRHRSGETRIGAVTGRRSASGGRPMAGVSDGDGDGDGVGIRYAAHRVADCVGKALRLGRRLCLFSRRYKRVAGGCPLIEDGASRSCAGEQPGVEQDAEMSADGADALPRRNDQLGGGRRVSRGRR